MAAAFIKGFEYQNITHNECILRKKIKNSPPKMSAAILTNNACDKRTKTGQQVGQLLDCAG